MDEGEQAVVRGEQGGRRLRSDTMIGMRSMRRGLRRRVQVKGSRIPAYGDDGGLQLIHFERSRNTIALLRWQAKVR